MGAALCQIPYSRFFCHLHNVTYYRHQEIGSILELGWDIEIRAIAEVGVSTEVGEHTKIMVCAELIAQTSVEAHTEVGKRTEDVY